MQYLYNDEALRECMSNLDDPTKYEVQRYKGLGEMDAQQLWETTMEPESRTLRQVRVEDAAEVDRIVSELMGSDVLGERLLQIKPTLDEFISYFSNYEQLCRHAQGHQT